jgi:hypothetical protein
VNNRVFDWATGNKGLDIVEGSAPTETKEEEFKAQTSENDDDHTLGPDRVLSGNLSGQADLRREQREQLERNHSENRATEKKARPITYVTNTACGK